MCDGVKTSEIQYDGPKLTCDDESCKPCQDMNEVIQHLHNLACKPIVLYSEVKNPGGATPTPATLTSTTYVVPPGGDGEYEVDYTFDATFLLTGAVHNVAIIVDLFKNGASYNSDIKRNLSFIDATSSNGDTKVVTGRYFASKISLAAGDEIEMTGLLNPDNSSINNAVCKITKIKKA